MKTYFFTIALFINFCVVAQHTMQVVKSFDTPEISAKTIADAQKAYDIISNAPIVLDSDKKIANNCENRAEFGFTVLSKMGFKPVNFWIYKEGYFEDDKGGLEYNTGRKIVHWRYHVAAGIIIPSESGYDTLIYDPWTQHKLTSLKAWATSFFIAAKPRKVFVFSVTDNYYFFPTNNNKLVTSKEDWNLYKDSNLSQMYCGLAGITPNGKCSKKRFRDDINDARNTILAYLYKHGIML